MRRLLVALCVLASASPLVVTSSTVAAAGGTEASTAAAPFTARGSVNQVYAYGLGVGTTVSLKSQDGTVTFQSGTSDAQGAYLFREVEAGSGYQVVTAAGTVSDITVTDSSQHPTEQWYADQAAAHPISQGFGYLETRDGTTLSINVTFPDSSAGPGPWPVVVNYSGYDPSQPGSPPQEATVYTYQGYVVVGVNLRGTTCSGGAFEFMEELQGLDGYDVVETLAKQSWSNGHVGLVGISYSGYSQLYVGATNPPHLDAIAPASPYSDTYSGILYPGGILNDGFALGWATERQDDAKPKAHGWVRTRINNGDTTCANNQVMRLQSKPLLDRIHNTPFADHRYDYLNTETFVHKIKMPTLLSAQWQDEQTGGSSANLVPLFDPATKVFANFTNGTHVEPMGPEDIQDQMNFIDVYVGKRVPHTSSLLTLGAPSVLADLFNAPNNDADFALPFNSWAGYATYAEALAAWEAQPRVKIRWENGAKAGKEGLPLSTTSTRYTAWPVPGTTNEKLYFQPDGGLNTAAPTVADTARRASSAYTYDPTTKRASTFDGSTDAAWAAHPNYKWNVLAEGNALSFLSAPYTSKVAYAGQGSVDVWLRSSATDTDLEATLTEVRPDGKEMYIQSGWLRASHRTEDPARSTELVPYQDHQEDDAAPLPAGQFTKVRIELFPFAHIMRPGSRLRVNIEAPGGNQPFWKFETIDGTATNEVGHSAGMPSRVVLPRLPSAPFFSPGTVPPCSVSGVTTQAVSNRNQPCRTYTPDRKATGVAAAAVDGDVHVTWTAPAGDAPTTYTVTPHLGAGAPDGSVAPAPVEVAGSTAAADIVGVPTGVPLEFTVVATYGTTDAPASDASLPVTVDHVAKRLFGTWQAFVTRQLTDALGSAKAADVTADVAAIEGGQSPEAYILSLRDGADATTNVDPVTRLYWAYFQRTPDRNGQGYWVGKRRNGTTLIKVSNTFAASSEFKTKYGALSNNAFVQLVYQNVLGRAGDASGVAYWTGKLDRRSVSRGQVMLNFSESNEFKTKSADRVDVINLYFALLHRAPTTTQLNDALADLAGGSTRTDLVADLLASSEYAALVGG